MRRTNIYQNENYKLKEVLTQYNLGEILYVPIEVGKYNLESSVINFFGDIIIPTFRFPYNNHGIRFFSTKIEKAIKRCDARKVFIGLEASGHYHINLTFRLESLGYSVEVINPIDTWKDRINAHTKTDHIDLQAIARVLISNKGTRIAIPEGVYYDLHRVTRTRRHFVKCKVSSKNIITSLVDRIFPGLWSKQDPIFSDNWGKGSLLLLEHYPHPQQVIRLGVNRLSRFLQRNNTKLREKTAHKIMAAAKNSPSRPLKDVKMDILALKYHIKALKYYLQTITELEGEIAKLLVQTPGTYLLSIPGISLVYAGDFVGAIGNISRFTYYKQIISLAGNCPRVNQSAEYTPDGSTLSQHGKNFLRTTLNQIALSLSAHCPEFHRYYCNKQYQKPDKPGIAKIATGNKFVKLAFALMTKETLYRPNPLYVDEREYYLSVYQKMIHKLHPFSVDDVPKERNYLLKIKKKYKLKL
ncbi:MAG: IS110 family transposase [Thermodesulfobacteriota bacterium]